MLAEVGSFFRTFFRRYIFIPRLSSDCIQTTLLNIRIEAYDGYNKILHILIQIRQVGENILFLRMETVQRIRNIRNPQKIIYADVVVTAMEASVSADGCRCPFSYIEYASREIFRCAAVVL